MDIWKFYDVTHREHVFCNPMTVAKIDRLIRLFRLVPGSRVLDIASGKGEFLVRLAEQYEIGGMGIDISPYFVADAKKRLTERVPEARIDFLEMDGADFVPEQTGSYDLASCLGASWIFQGHRGTLEGLLGMVAPGGWIVVGEPHWLRDPDPDYLKAIEDRRETYGTHAGNVLVGEELGLELAYTLVSDPNDWDEYEGLQWYAARNYARAHPEDPDAEEILKRVAVQRDAYVKWGRDTLGWAIYAFRRATSGTNG